MTPERAGDVVGHLLRYLATPRVLGAVASRLGDFAAAEDAVQEALIAAAERWTRDGVPAVGGVGVRPGAGRGAVRGRGWKKFACGCGVPVTSWGAVSSLPGDIP